MLRSMTSIMKAAAVVLVIGAVATYAAITRITLYRNTVELELLKDRYESHLVLQSTADQSQSDRITSLEKTVYVAPNPKDAPTARRPAAVEQWMINADSELRKRILALERWRLKHEDQ